MMKVCYSEMDTPAGLNCRLEAAGHAGYAPAGQDAVDVHQGLGRPGGHHAGQGAAREGHGVLAAAGGDYRLAGLDDIALLAADQADALLEDAVGDGVGPELHARVSRLAGQGTGYLIAACTGHVLGRAEELVYLLEELAARAGILVHEHDLGSGPGRLDGGAEPGGPGAYNYDLSFDGLHLTFPLIAGRAAPGRACRPSRELCRCEHWARRQLSSCSRCSGPWRSRRRAAHGSFPSCGAPGYRRSPGRRRWARRRGRLWAGPRNKW